MTTNKLFKEIQPHVVKKFVAFHKKNPEVYKLVKKFAKEARKSGRDRFSIKMIWERIRWYTTVETNDNEPFKLSNSYHSCYARLLMSEDPFYQKLFVRKTTNKKGTKV